MRAGRVVPLLPVLLLVGCAEFQAVLGTSQVEVPDLEREAIVAYLANKGLTLETASEAELTLAAKNELSPLPVQSARLQDGRVLVTLGPLSEPVIQELLNKISVGGIAGVAGGGIASGASLIYLILRWRDLKRRADAKKAAPAAKEKSK